MKNENPLPLDINPDFTFEGANYRASIKLEIVIAPGGVICNECNRLTVAPTEDNVPDHGVEITTAVVNGLFSTDGMHGIDLESYEANEVIKHILSVLRKPTYICDNCFPRLEKTLSK